MNMPCRDIEPGSPKGEQEVMGGVECDWKHENDVKGVGCDGNGGRKGGAMSAAHCDLK